MFLFQFFRFVPADSAISRHIPDSNAETAPSPTTTTTANTPSPTPLSIPNQPTPVPSTPQPTPTLAAATPRCGKDSKTGKPYYVDRCGELFLFLYIFFVTEKKKIEFFFLF